MPNLVWLVAVGLLVLWAGLNSAAPEEGFAHVVLALAIVAMVARFVLGRWMQ